MGIVGVMGTLLKGEEGEGGELGLGSREIGGLGGSGIGIRYVW